MNDNLPEIDFKEKKEKKGGFLGWLMGRLGMGARGGAMGEAGMNPAAMNLGRAALGGAKFGASSSGLAGLLAARLAMTAAVAAVAGAGGLYIANNAPAPSTGNSAFNSGKTGRDYVPAILRSQAANQGSSLDMFKDTNKGSGLGMEADPNAAKKEPEANPAPADEAAAQDANPADPGQGANMGQDMMAKLQGGSMGGSLTSSLGGGSSKFSAMGGFGNKFNSGATGAKAGFTSGIGTGFGGMPKFDARKNKMLAMKGNARPVFSGAKAGGKGSYGPKSLGQAKGLRNQQKSYTGKEVDQMRSTQDKAWTGSTAEGNVGAGGAGLGDGGAGVMTSPSLDTGGSSGGGGGAGVGNEPVVPPATPPTDDSPWKGLPEKAMALIVLSVGLAVAGSLLVDAGYAAAAVVGAGTWMITAGKILCGIAAAIAVGAIIIGIQLMASHGQSMMGAIYTLGGGVSATRGVLAGWGDPTTSLSAPSMMLLAAAAVVSLFGSMMGGK